MIARAVASFPERVNNPLPCRTLSVFHSSVFRKNGFVLSLIFQHQTISEERFFRLAPGKEFLIFLFRSIPDRQGRCIFACDCIGQSDQEKAE